MNNEEFIQEVEFDLQRFTQTRDITVPMDMNAELGGNIARLAGSYKSNIYITKLDRTVKASSLMFIVGLGIKSGDVVTITAEGDDEGDAINAVGNYIEYYDGTPPTINNGDNDDGETIDLTIENADDLKELANYVNAGHDCDGLTFKLTDNINLSGINFTAIGTESNPFKGTFDGGNHTIRNLTINNSSADNQGLFGYNSGTIKNLNLANANVTGKICVGGIVGNNTGNVQNVFTVSCTVTGTIAICRNVTNLKIPIKSQIKISVVVGLQFIKNL